MPSSPNKRELPEHSLAKALEKRRARLDQDGGGDLSPRLIATCSASQLEANYHAIRELALGREMIPMIKAQAYGHGAVWAARILGGLPGLYGLGVATLEEGAEIRKVVLPRVRIVVFSGGALWTPAKRAYCELHGLSPVISSEADWDAFDRAGDYARVSYELKFNTGMNRLGIAPSSAPRILKKLKTLPSGQRPHAVLSHLATAEDTEAKLTRVQLERFAELRGQFDSALPGTQFHLANSSAIWNARKYGIDRLTDAVRPGLSLYGVPPWKGASERGIGAVLTLEAQLVQKHLLQAGESVGYGATFVVPKGGEPVRVGVISGGYADGIHRMLSGFGYAWVGGREARFLGRVSMDLAAVRLSTDVAIGERVQLIGPNVDPWAQSEAAGTIPYELLTSIAPRVTRKYI